MPESTCPTTPRVAVVGSGYVGTVAAGLASLGRQVSAVESDPRKLRELMGGRSPIYEPGLGDLLVEALSSGRLHLTDDMADALAGSEVVFLCVGTLLDAGVGWGGSCFGKDLQELISTGADYGHEPPLLRAVTEVNIRQRQVIVEKLRRHLKTLRGRRVCLLGLAFKPGTDDLRDAPALDVVRQLIAAGVSVRAHDPMVGPVPHIPEMRTMSDIDEAARGADAVVMMTEWPDYVGIDAAMLRSVMRGRLMIDGRNIFDPATMAGHGFVYEGVGRALPGGPHSSRARDQVGSDDVELEGSAV
jgi:UDP-glucose 6-dehydrogenase